MKTAISIPDDVFRKAERLAKRMKKSRSQLYTEAVRRYIADRDAPAVTARINEALAKAGKTGNEAFMRRAAQPDVCEERMVALRGEVWWADLGEPRGSEPGYHRPVVIVQANVFNRSRLETIIVVALTTNLRLAAVLGNVVLDRHDTGLSKDSVANVSQVTTINRSELLEKVGMLPERAMSQVDEGIRVSLSV